MNKNINGSYKQDLQQFIFDCAMDIHTDCDINKLVNTTKQNRQSSLYHIQQI